MVRIPPQLHADSPLSNLDNLLNCFSLDAADAWLRRLFGSYDTSMRSEFTLGANKNEREYFGKAVALGYVKELPQAPRVDANCPVIVVSVSMKHDLAGRDSRVAQFIWLNVSLKKPWTLPA